MQPFSIALSNLVIWGLLLFFNYVAVKIPNYYKEILNSQEAFFFFFSQFFPIK